MQGIPPIPELHKQFMDELYGQYFEFLFRYAMTKLGKDEDAAAQCTHAVFDTALNNIEKLKNHENIGGWMMKTLKNNIKGYHRTKLMRLQKNYLFLAKHRRVDMQYELWIDNMIEHQQIENLKEDVIMKLSPKDRELYRLYYEDHNTVKQISKILGISEAAAKMRLSRMRNRVYDYINNIF